MNEIVITVEPGALSKIKSRAVWMDCTGMLQEVTAEGKSTAASVSKCVLKLRKNPEASGARFRVEGYPSLNGSV